MTATTVLDDAPTPIAQLRTELRGRVTTPGDDAYESAREVFFPVAGHPAAFVRVADVADVERAVTIAAASGTPLAVRSGGHSVAGHSTPDGGVVLDLGDLDEVEIDPEARHAWVGGGATAGAYTVAAGEHGLATGFGDSPTVGIAGLTLGGGIGLLVREHGLTIDQLLAAEVVTADGRRRTVDAEHDPELFWALRGGGGNLGVVTRLKLRLQPVPQVVAGELLLPANEATIAGFVAAADAAPRAVSTIAIIMIAPAMPDLPDAAVGHPVLWATVVHAGPVADAERDLAPFRDLAEPLSDTISPLSYSELFPEPPRPPFTGFAIETGYLDEVGATEARTILDRLAMSAAPMSMVQLRVLGGAIDDVPADATAYAHRGRRLLFTTAAGYLDASEREQHEAWVDDTARALRRDDASYIGFLQADGIDRVRGAYPGAAWGRLQAVKTRVDPDNLFRGNHNVPPSPSHVD